MDHTHLAPRSDLFAQTVPPTVRAFLPPELAELVEDSLLLHRNAAVSENGVFNDYAFVVFPLAKAYEGFLKIFFFQLGVVKKDVYHARHFRIGRSFNPDLHPNLRDASWLYDDAVRLCGEDVARELWQIWLDARNHLFHFFPADRYVLTNQEAGVLIGRLLAAMQAALACRPRG
jgi:hypothetical protein